MKIEKIKKVGKKYKIEFDNQEKITTYDDVILENGLLYHQEVDSNLLNKININHNYYDVYYKIINFISRRLRSKKEIIEFIDKMAVNNKDKEEIIKKLSELGLINDSSFAHAYASDKFYLSTSGPYKIRKELMEHHISEEEIEKALSSITNEMVLEKLKKLISKKVNHSKYSKAQLKQKLINEMSNLGYDKDMILLIYDGINKDDSTLLKNEYNKWYKKLSMKYEGSELNKRIKQKLYQKGFQLDDINQILE